MVGGGTNILERLHNLESKATQYLRMIDLLRKDEYLEYHGYYLSFAIDFSEIFRYLYPEFDNTKYKGEETFFVEQLAIHYAFERFEKSLILLSPYREEFVRFCSRATHAIESYEKDLVAKKAIDLFDQVLTVDVEKLDSAKLEKFRKECLSGYIDLLNSELRETFLKRLLEKFVKLLQDDKLVVVKDVQDLGEEPTIDDKDPDFLDILSDITRRRPSTYDSNVTDAKAILVAQRITKQNIDEKRIVLLVTGSGLSPAQRRVSFTVPIDGRGTEVPVYRDLYYFLLRIYYETVPYEESIYDLNRLEELIKEYSDLVRRFRKRVPDPTWYGDKPLSDALAELYFKLSYHIDLFRNLYEGHVAEPFVVDTHARTRKAYEFDILAVVDTIRSLLADPEKLRRELGKIKNDLKKAVESLVARLDELGLAPK